MRDLAHLSTKQEINLGELRQRRERISASRHVMRLSFSCKKHEKSGSGGVQRPLLPRDRLARDGVHRMGLRISIDAVTHVLLADGWHAVDKRSFNLDTYEYLEDGEVIYTGGKHAAIPATGAKWLESDGTEVSCPLNSVLAVRSRKIPAAQRK
jgi:hypothetical protein